MEFRELATPGFGRSRWYRDHHCPTLVGETPTLLEGFARIVGIDAGRCIYWQRRSAIQSLADPFRIPAAINNRPDNNLIAIQGVENRIGEHPTQKPVVITIRLAMYSGCYFQPLDIRPQVAGEVVAESRLLRLVEPKPFGQVLQRIIGDPDSNHRLPMVCLKVSQSRSVAAPAVTRDRRRSSSSRCSRGTSHLSTCSPRSRQMASMI